MLKMSKAQVEGESRDVFIETSVCGTTTGNVNQLYVYIPSENKRILFVCVGKKAKQTTKNNKSFFLGFKYLWFASLCGTHSIIFLVFHFVDFARRERRRVVRCLVVLYG